MSILLVFHVLLVSVLTIRILLRDDLMPPARLAWFVVLNLLSYLWSVVYFLFGENDLGRAADRRHQEVFDEIRDKAGMFMGDASIIDSLIYSIYRPALHYAGSINGFEPRNGYAAELMAGADITRVRLVADIDAGAIRTHVPDS